MFINTQPMLDTIDIPIKYRYLVLLDSSNTEDLYHGLDNFLRRYNRAGYFMKLIYCGGEFKSIMDEVAYILDIYMNYANPNNHAPNIERNNQVVRERFRIAYYRLIYNKIPKFDYTAPCDYFHSKTKSIYI